MDLSQLDRAGAWVLLHCTDIDLTGTRGIMAGVWSYGADHDIR